MLRFRKKMNQKGLILYICHSSTMKMIFIKKANILQLLVLSRYRSLIPLIYLLLIIEIALRIFIGHIKPIYFSHTPPGMIANWVLLPIACFMFILSIRSAMSAEMNTWSWYKQRFNIWIPPMTYHNTKIFLEYEINNIIHN